VDLIDPATAEEELLGRALVLGPGVREMENLLGVIQGALDQASGRGRFVPIVELRVLEGGFGAGPGANLNWENRLDVGLQARWNLTDLLTAGPRTDAARSRIQQAQLTYDDLRARLTTGVREAKLAVNAGKEQVPVTWQQLRHAQKTYELSNRRLLDRIEGATTAEVLAAIRALELAHLNSLNVIRSYNKAQVRLLVLTGAIAGNAGRECP
jgi:outer membrane protein TolC